MPNRLDRRALERLLPLIELELNRRLQEFGAASAPPVPAVLRTVFTHLCGANRDADEETLFLAFAAGVAREIALHCALHGHLPPSEAHRWIAFGRWFHRMHSFDPLCTRMIDLFYFGGLGPRRTAALVGVSRAGLIRELRFAKAWWMQARLREAS